MEGSLSEKKLPQGDVREKGCSLEWARTLARTWARPTARKATGSTSCSNLEGDRHWTTSSSEEMPAYADNTAWDTCRIMSQLAARREAWHVFSHSTKVVRT